MMEFLSWYLESVSAFWISLAGGGLFKVILIGCLIYWICGRRMRWRCHRHGYRCPHCGCQCGHCPCGASEDGDDEGGEDGNDEDREDGNDEDREDGNDEDGEDGNDGDLVIE